jgi:ribosome-interacting GTPase 1
VWGRVSAAAAPWCGLAHLPPRRAAATHHLLPLRAEKTGGIKFSSVVPLTKLGDDPYKTVYSILHEYKIHNADLLFR